MNPRGGRLLVLLGMAISCLAVASYSEQAPSIRRASFTSPDGLFRFFYPSDFEVCTPGRIEPCIHSYIPACDQDAIVCVVYPAKQFKETSFGAAAFEVRELRTDRETMTADVCVTPYPSKSSAGVSEWPEYLISARQPAKVIGGVLFVHGIKVEGAMSHSSSVDLYRTFHGGRCFELSVSQSGTDPHAFDPPKQGLTAQQQKKVDGSMNQIVQSFRFIK
ncbi:hypothetical protein P8935_15385 [Telmatobacter sp. DSM 110680]|uniref:Uncharacterized protein n=1 Tax=Telmatobacter sp. DSM 110680 TaxID=3036704 RepID=A0AAU7DFB1_9BACT